MYAYVGDDPVNKGDPTGTQNVTTTAMGGNAPYWTNIPVQTSVNGWGAPPPPVGYPASPDYRGNSHISPYAEGVFLMSDPQNPPTTGDITRANAEALGRLNGFPKGIGSYGLPGYRNGWPTNEGFVRGTEKQMTLPAGTLLTRYGTPGGYYLSPQGTPFDIRGLPASSAAKPFYTYEVTRDLVVTGGIARNAFGGTGGGVQYRTDTTISGLLGNYLREVK